MSNIAATCVIHDDTMQLWFPKPEKLVRADLESICTKFGKMQENDRGILCQISIYSLQPFIRAFLKVNLILVMSFKHELI